MQRTLLPRHGDLTFQLIDLHRVRFSIQPLFQQVTRLRSKIDQQAVETSDDCKDLFHRLVIQRAKVLANVSSDVYIGLRATAGCGIDMEGAKETLEIVELPFALLPQHAVPAVEERGRWRR